MKVQTTARLTHTTVVFPSVCDPNTRNLKHPIEQFGIYFRQQRNRKTTCNNLKMINIAGSMSL